MSYLLLIKLEDNKIILKHYKRNSTLNTCKITHYLQYAIVCTEQYAVPCGCIHRPLPQQPPSKPIWGVGKAISENQKSCGKIKISYLLKTGSGISVIVQEEEDVQFFLGCCASSVFFCEMFYSCCSPLASCIS